MMATAEEYAAWIVKNQDKKGSPEFDTVAQAYKIARSGVKATAQTNPAEATLAEKIARDPFTRLAIGTAEPLQAYVQRLSELPDTPFIPLMLAKYGAAAARPALDTAFAETKKMSNPNNEFDGMGVLGNIASPVSLATAKVPIPASLAGKTAVGAGAGAVGGALAPADTEQASAGNSSVGAAVGAVLPPVISGVGKLAEKTANTLVRPITDLFTKQGPQNIVNRYIRGDKVVGEERLPTMLAKLRGVDDLIAGGNPTVAEALVGAPEGSPVAALQGIVSKTGGGNSARFGERLSEQNTAIKAAEMARDAAAEPARATALEAAKTGGVSARPVLATVGKLAGTEGYRASDVASKSLAEIEGKLTRWADPDTGIINPNDLYTIRKEIGSTIKKFSTENANWDKGMTAKLEREIQLSIDDAIENAGGIGWKKYLDDYAKASRLIDSFKTRQELALKPPQTTNLGGGINVAEETRPHMPNLLSRPAMIANWAMRKAGGGVEPKIDRVMADMLLNPGKFADEMSKKAPLTKVDIEKWLRASNALTAAGASSQ